MRAITVLGVIFLLTGTGAWAQQYRPEASAGAVYRDGQAPVMAPAPMEAQKINQSSTAFAEHYRSAGRPRIALFWNIALTDSLSNEKVKQTTSVGSGFKSSNSTERTTGSQYNNVKTRDGEERGGATNTVTQREYEIDRTRRQMSNLTEADAWKIETGFSGKMAEAGVRFLDRAAIMRLTHAQDGDSSNTRLVESKALIGMADLVLEVLSTRDAQAPSGYGFRVTLKDLKTGQQKAAFYSQAAPEVLAPERRYVAGPSGYVPAPAPVVGVDEVGRALAIDTMRELLGRLR